MGGWFSSLRNHAHSLPDGFLKRLTDFQKNVTEMGMLADLEKSSNIQFECAIIACFMIVENSGVYDANHRSPRKEN